MVTWRECHFSHTDVVSLALKENKVASPQAWLKRFQLKKWIPCSLWPILGIDLPPSRPVESCSDFVSKWGYVSGPPHIWHLGSMGLEKNKPWFTERKQFLAHWQPLRRCQMPKHCAPTERTVGAITRCPVCVPLGLSIWAVVKDSCICQYWQSIVSIG